MEGISDNGDLQIEEEDDVGARRRGRRIKIELIKPDPSTSLEILIDAARHNFLSVNEAWEQKLLNNDMDKNFLDKIAAILADTILNTGKCQKKNDAVLFIEQFKDKYCKDPSSSLWYEFSNIVTKKHRSKRDRLLTTYKVNNGIMSKSSKFLLIPLCEFEEVFTKEGDDAGFIFLKDNYQCRRRYYTKKCESGLPYKEIFNGIPSNIPLSKKLLDNDIRSHITEDLRTFLDNFDKISTFVPRALFTKRDGKYLWICLIDEKEINEPQKCYLDFQGIRHKYHHISKAIYGAMGLFIITKCIHGEKDVKKFFEAIFNFCQISSNSFKNTSGGFSLSSIALKHKIADVINGTNNNE